MSKIKIGAQVTAKARPTKVTVSGTFQGYELEDQENPTSICGKVFYVKDGKQCLAHVYIDSIEVCDSEDERIRKDLITFICQFAPEHLKVQYVAYLEKQKEQKPIPKFKVGDRIYDKKDSYNRNVIREVGKDYYINAFAQKMDMAYTDANFEFLEHLDNDPIDSKFAEWSEEDDACYETIKGILEDNLTEEDKPEYVLSWFKTHYSHSHWKPSEKQMKVLDKVYHYLWADENATADMQDGLGDFIDELKSL